MAGMHNLLNKIIIIVIMVKISLNFVVSILMA